MDSAPTSSPSSDDRLMAMLAHLLAIPTGFVGPLILFFVLQDRSRFVVHHAKESLNFQITVLLAVLVAGLLLCVGIGFLFLIAIGVAALVFEILAAIAANSGTEYRYPVALRLVA